MSDGDGVKVLLSLPIKALELDGEEVRRVGDLSRTWLVGASVLAIVAPVARDVVRQRLLYVRSQVATGNSRLEIDHQSSLDVPELAGDVLASSALGGRVQDETSDCLEDSIVARFEISQRIIPSEVWDIRGRQLLRELVNQPG